MTLVDAQNQIDCLAKKIWAYMVMNQTPEKADAILVFGSYNPIVALRAVELYQAGYAPIVVFSGNRSDSTTTWAKTEAETMAELAIKNGLPKQVVRLEKEAKNSGENTRFSRELLLAKEGILPKKIIVVQKPYAERRTFATVRAQWPEVEVIVTSPQMTYEEYMATSPKGKRHSILVMLGDLLRIKSYPEKGFQIYQEIPREIEQASEELARLGYETSGTS